MLEHIKSLYPIKRYLEWRYDRTFETHCNSCFRGVFSSFEQALRSAPQNRQSGFDTPEFAEQYPDRLTSIHQYDYPVMFWLDKILSHGQRLFDCGGHVGLQFYAYQKYLTYPSGLEWLVCDVSSVVEKGRAIAAERGVTNLEFTESFYEADGCDIFFGAGVIQYIETPLLAEMLGVLNNKPKHLLLNKLPLYEGPEFVTLQNTGVSYVPLYVFNRDDFIAQLEEIGYRVVDSWLVHELKCNIPFFPERRLKHYSGLYLALQ